MKLADNALAPEVQAGPPPGYPWQDLRPDSAAPSYLCFYYSSPITALAVRDVNRTTRVGGSVVADCKSDPNLETKTFGLFSTCQAQTRQGIVKRRSPYMFFFCKRNLGSREERCVTGFYELKWFAHGGTHRGDFCLAASRAHFIAKPLSFREINAELGTDFGPRFPPRVMCSIEADLADQLRKALEYHENVVDNYIDEIRRLENLNARESGGLRYINFGRSDPFDWDSIHQYENLGKPSNAPRIPNGSSQGLWHCSTCKQTSVSQSRLKLCPACKAEGSLLAIEPNNN